MAIAAFSRHAGCISAVVTNELIYSFMIGQVDSTLNTDRNPSAFRTLNVWREASSVLEKNYLLLIAKSVIHRLKQFRSKMRNHKFFPVGFPGIGKYDRRKFCLLYTSPSPRDRTRSRM